jgi:hypothetical protein
VSGRPDLQLSLYSMCVCSVCLSALQQAVESLSHSRHSGRGELFCVAIGLSHTLWFDAAEPEGTESLLGCTRSCWGVGGG